MFTNIIATAVLYLANRLSFHMDGQAVYTAVVHFLEHNQITFFSSCTLIAIILVILSYFFTDIGLFKIAYLLSKVLRRLSGFLIFFLSVLHVWLWLQTGAHLFAAGGYFALAVLFILLAASCLSIKIIDFNYHMMNSLVNHFSVVILAILFVELIGPRFIH